MPLDEYTSASGGALRLKGAKVEKHKKKHKKGGREKEKKKDRSEEKRRDKNKNEDKDKTKTTEAHTTKDAASDDDDDPYARMTAAERRFAEAQDQKIRNLMHATPEEAKAARPDLFKSHRERVADLNTYLSRMSEHNDMPKIGPG